MTASSKTTLELVTESLREIGVIRATQTPTAEAVQQAIPKLNEMVVDWEADGIELNWYPVSQGSDVLPINERDERLLISNFAVELAGKYGVPVQEPVLSVARMTKGRAEKNTVSIVESDLGHLPGTSGYHWYDISSG